jgi:hypothetical protein
MGAPRACESGVNKTVPLIAKALPILALGFLLGWGLVLVQSDRAQAQSLSEKDCGHVSPKIRRLHTFGYNDHRALRCRTGRKVARRWVALNCGRKAGDICQFNYVGRHWHCTVGVALYPKAYKGKRVTGCNNQKTVGLSFFYR